MYLTHIAQACPWDANLREMRAECQEATGHFQSAISDIKYVPVMFTINDDR